MLIISNISEEGVFNLDHISHIQIKELINNNEKIYTLMLSGDAGVPKFMGEFVDKDQATIALNRIIRANHEGNREVIL